MEDIIDAERVTVLFNDNDSRKLPIKWWIDQENNKWARMAWYILNLNQGEADLLRTELFIRPHTPHCEKSQAVTFASSRWQF